jgi:O-acetylhomoserine (thiol)-lyase
MPNGSCGVISFGVKGGKEAAQKFMSALKLGMIATHVADARTCCLHPASTTHDQLSEEELAACGVSGDMIRLSVGIENVNDLLADISQALEKSQK